MTNTIVASAAMSLGAGTGVSVFASGAGAAGTILAFSDSPLPTVSPSWNYLASAGGASFEYAAWRVATLDSRDAVTGSLNVAAVVISGSIGSFTSVHEAGTTGSETSTLTIPSGAGLAVVCSIALDNTGAEAASPPSGFTNVNGDDDNEPGGSTSSTINIASKSYSSGVSAVLDTYGNLQAAGMLIGVVAGGGTNYPRSLADTVSISDSPTDTRALGRALADTVSVSDSPARARGLARVLADTVSISDATGRTTALHTATSDSVPVSDSPAEHNTRTRTLADNVSISDAVSDLKVKAANLADTVTISDTTTSLRRAARALTDAVPVSDTPSILDARTRALADTLGITDAVTAIIRTAGNAPRVLKPRIVLAVHRLRLHLDDGSAP